jgi:hypothetical protein
MFQKLVSHNDDIRRLVEKGYAVAFDSGYLIVRDVPYLDSGGQLQIGAIVTKLDFIDQERVKQVDHQVFFTGSAPHGLDGRPIPNLGGGPTPLALSEDCTDVIVQRSFSNKPRETGAFEDFFHKIESYVTIISGPAIEKYGADPCTFRAVEKIVPHSVFKFHDTLTSRAEIGDLSDQFKNDIVAVIGLGGTGAYVLDFLVKTPVREVRGFDADAFHVHNAFRSPGKLDPTELGKSKADVYGHRYENFRYGLSVHPKFVDASSSTDLEGVTFAFVCVDNGLSRAAIFELLLSNGIPFIDVGMGLKRKGNPLRGMLRVTYYSAEHGREVRDKGFSQLTENADDIYHTNIQISELNALNASLAVLRFKQLRGFYLEEIPYDHLTFGVGDLKTAGDWPSNEG